MASAFSNLKGSVTIAQALDPERIIGSGTKLGNARHTPAAGDMLALVAKDALRRGFSDGALLVWQAVGGGQPDDFSRRGFGPVVHSYRVSEGERTEVIYC